MKKLKIKLSVNTIIFIIATVVTLTGCQKNVQIVSNLGNSDKSNYSPMVANGPPILGLIIDYGTRKGAKNNKEHDEKWGTNFDNGKLCQNKGMCLHTSNSLELSDTSDHIVINGDDVIEGGLLIDIGQPITEGSGRWNISKDENGTYFVEIRPADILPATKQKQFGDGYFYQEFEYILPSFISDYFDGEQIILHKGYHSITEESDGTIKFFL